MTGWRDGAVCRADPDMWFTASLRSAAVHICRQHCPVVNDCYEALQYTRIAFGVMGGQAFAADGVPMTSWGVGKSAEVCGPYCRAFRRSAGEGE